MSTEPLAAPISSAGSLAQSAQQDAQRARDSEWGWVPVAVSLLVLAMGAVTGWAVAMKHLREDGIVVGFVISAVTLVLNYWLGTSRSSEKNGATVRQIATSPPPSTVATTVTDGQIDTSVKTGAGAQQ